MHLDSACGSQCGWPMHLALHVVVSAAANAFGLHGSQCGWPLHSVTEIMLGIIERLRRVVRTCVLI